VNLSAATGRPRADELASRVERFLAIAHFVDTCERPGPVVLTHKDIQVCGIADDRVRREPTSQVTSRGSFSSGSQPSRGPVSAP
jgi:hypothetical protein